MLAPACAGQAGGRWGEIREAHKQVASPLLACFADLPPPARSAPTADLVATAFLLSVLSVSFVASFKNPVSPSPPLSPPLSPIDRFPGTLTQ